MAGVEELGGAPQTCDSRPPRRKEPHQKMEESKTSSPVPLSRLERARKEVGRVSWRGKSSARSKLTTGVARVRFGALEAKGKIAG